MGDTMARMNIRTVIIIIMIMITTTIITGIGIGAITTPIEL